VEAVTDPSRDAAGGRALEAADATFLVVYDWLKYLDRCLEKSVVNFLTGTRLLTFSH